MLDVLSNGIGTGRRKVIKSRLFVFTDYSVPEKYADFKNDLAFSTLTNVIEEHENFDMEGTLTKIVVYEDIEDE